MSGKATDTIIEIDDELHIKVIESVYVTAVYGYINGVASAYYNIHKWDGKYYKANRPATALNAFGEGVKEHPRLSELESECVNLIKWNLL